MNEHDIKQPQGTLPLPVVVQPDPMLEERAGPFRTTLMGLGGAFVVIMVLYGLSRPPEPQPAASPPQATAQNTPAPTAQPETTGSGQQAGQQGNAKQNGAQPTTTGQGEAAKDQPKQPSKQGQAGGEKRSDSATTGKATAPPSDKAQPKQ
jgi:hypothetical protein